MAYLSQHIVYPTGAGLKEVCIIMCTVCQTKIIYIYIKPYYAHLLPQVGKSFTRFNTDKQSNREQS